MQFLNPAAFYLLGFIPIVVALHFPEITPPHPPRSQHYALALH